MNENKRMVKRNLRNEANVDDWEIKHVISICNSYNFFFDLCIYNKLIFILIKVFIFILYHKLIKFYFISF